AGDWKPLCHGERDPKDAGRPPGLGCILYCDKEQSDNGDTHKIHIVGPQTGPHPLQPEAATVVLSRFGMRRRGVVLQRGDHFLRSRHCRMATRIVMTSS